MDIEIQGNSTFQCTLCQHHYSLDASDIPFQEDISDEASLSEISRYLAYYHNTCKKCNGEQKACFEVWEKPAGVTNGIHYQETNLHIIDCEFSIHYDGDSPPWLESYNEYDVD